VAHHHNVIAADLIVAGRKDSPESSVGTEDVKV
jgi:hypothetical protein